MKKMAQSLLTGLVLVSCVLADEITVGEKFIGLEVGYNKIQGSRYMTPGDVDTYFEFYEGEDVEFGVRIGAQNDEWKSTVLFDYFDSQDHDQNTEKLLLLVDYSLWNTQVNDIEIKPYLGANVGYMNYESTLIEESGFLYGTQAGVALSLSEIIEVDLSYRYSLMSMDTVDHTESVFFGLNYLY